MEHADRAVERRGLADLGPRHREDVADEHVLEVLGLRRRLAHRQDRGRGRHRVADADDRFLRDPRVLAADHREDRGADERERQADPVDRRRVRIAARERQQQRDRRAERRNLRQREIDEDDPALDDVHAQVGVDAGQDQAGDERRGQELDDLHERQVSHRYVASPALSADDQQVDVVVEELDVVGDLLDAADRRRHHQHLRAGVARDRVRRLQVEVRLDQDDLDVLPLHLLDQVERVRRRRRDAGLRFDVADDVEAERVGEVRPRPVVGDDLRALVRRHRRLPALLRLGEPPIEVGVPLREVRGVAGLSAVSFVLDRLRDPPAVLRIEPVVRVALRVDVAHRARDLPGRDVEDPRRSATRRDSPAPPGWIFALRLCVMSGGSQPISSSRPTTTSRSARVQLEDEARLRLDEMRILVALARAPRR